MSGTDSSADKRISGTSERREQIIQRLRQQGSVQVNDLSLLYGVSTRFATIWPSLKSRGLRFAPTVAR